MMFLAKQIVTLIVFPPFTGHDEVAHYAYLQIVAEEYRVPTIPNLSEFRAALERGERANLPGDYLPAELYPYCRYVLDWAYCDDPRWANSPPYVVRVGTQSYPWGWLYTANHPPLYYLVGGPILLAAADQTVETQQYLLRGLSILVGALTVLLAYFLARWLFPGDDFFALTVPTFVAFQPQLAYEAALVNNDVAGIAAVTGILTLLVRGIRDRFPLRQCAVLGLVLGVGLLFKSTTVIAVPAVGLAVVLGVGVRQARGWIGRGAVIAGIAALTIGPWYVFLWRTYGNLSGLEQVAALQWRWTYPDGDAPSLSDQLFSAEFAAMRWRETWGEFGWRLIHLSDRMLLAIAVPCVVATAGLLWFLTCNVVARGRVRLGGVRCVERWQMTGILSLLLTCLVSYGSVLHFGQQFSLTQARYYFPALPAAGVLLMIGLKAVLSERGQRFGAIGVLLGMIVLNLLIYTQYVVPYWHLAS